MKWSVTYKSAVLLDGSLLFPERLTKEFLESAQRTMGSYIYANQYLNQIIPEGQQTFSKHWISYYSEIPENHLTFAFIDPAISEAATADFTGVVVVSVDVQQNWYVRYAQRHKINPSKIIDLAFDIHAKFKPAIIGIEEVAYQKALVHFAFEEMKRRGKQIPIMGVKRGPDKTKETRILGLVPRFEWRNLFLQGGLHDLELELASFPRGAHDDILDSLASINEIVYYPQKPRRRDERPQPGTSEYEKWFIQERLKDASGGGPDY